MNQDHHKRLSVRLGAETNSPRASQVIKPWRGVFFEGPEPSQDSDGEEIPIWFVYVGDRRADPIGTVYRCLSFGPALRLARRMSCDRKLELIHEAMPA